MSSARATAHSPWLAVAGVCGVYVSFGLAIGVMAPLVDEISEDLGLSRSAMGSILGAWALIYVFTAVPAGAVVDRLGLRWSLLVGGFTITTSLVLRSLAGGPVSLFAAVAVFGVGGPLVSIATPKLVASLFDAEDRRLPTGLGVASPSLGSAIALAVTNPLLLPAFDGSWRAVLLVIAAVSFIATLGWLYASRAVAHVQQGATRTDRSTISRLLKLRSMRIILVIGMFSFFFSHALSNWLPEILSDTGQSDNAAGYLSAISVTVGILGSLTIARLVPNLRRPHVLVAIFVIIGLMVAGLGSLPFALLLIALGVLGFCRAGIIPLLFLEIMGDPDIGLSDIGAATGLFFAVAEIGGFAGPYAIGWVADATDGFGAATLLLTAVAGAAAVGAMALRFTRGTTDVY
jgi:cyanate permease